MRQHSPIHRASTEEVSPAADTLAAAFLDYPWTLWVIPEDRYRERLRELQRIYVQHAAEHGIVLVAADCAGVVALLPPDAPEPSAETVERIVELHGDRISRLGGEDGSAAAPSVEKTSAENVSAEKAPAEAAAAETAAWRLETLGVRPDARGRGLGSALIAAALREAREQGAASVALDVIPWDVVNTRNEMKTSGRMWVTTLASLHRRSSWSTLTHPSPQKDADASQP